MRLGVDLRCLQDGNRTGVGEVAWQTLRALSTRPGVELVGFANAAGTIDLPPQLERAVQVVRTRVPNKVKNLKLYLGLGEAIDVTLSKQTGAKLDALWLPNPSFAHVSKHCPVVLTVHDLSFFHYPEFFPRRGRVWYFPAVRRLLERGLPPRSKVVAVSQSTAQDLSEQFPALRSRLEVIYPGLTQDYFEPPTVAERQRATERLHLPTKFLLSVGTVEPRKNYQLLLRAYDELVRLDPQFPFDLVIAGGWGWRSKPLEHLYHSLPSRRRIHFTGYVSEADKRVLYAEAAAFLYPSYYEGFGIPVLEAMAAGLPVLASHSSSLPEVVGEAGVLLTPLNPNVWLQAIQWLMRDQTARTELATKARSRAREFSWEQAANAYYALFRELTS